jgi:glutathione peroxidase
MTFRQKFLKLVYPAFMWMSGLTKKNNQRMINKEKTTPPVSFFSLQGTANNGSPVSFEQFKGKKVLIVNTASDCGYTGQYAALQKLQEQYHEKLVVIGFPANDFQEQEKGDDKAIAEFCQVNYGVTFPLMQKNTVVAGAAQNPVFQWLTDKNKNGWNEQAPVWNFSKYLVDENGILLGYYAPSVEPLSQEIVGELV